jgi:signal transduction histidine kinase
MALSLIERSTSAEEQEQRLARMQVEIHRLDELIGQVLEFSRLRGHLEITRETVDLVSLSQEVIGAVKMEAEADEIEIGFKAPTSMNICGSHEWLRRAIENVLRNAIRHSPVDGAIRMDIELIDQERVTLAIADSGPGVPDEYVEAIFEPFVRLTPERSERGLGGGVGLAIARAAAEQHGGQVRAENIETGGLRVIFTLPLSAA